MWASSPASTAGLSDGSARVGVPVRLCGSSANPARGGSAVTATPEHPLLLRIRLPLLFTPTDPLSRQSFEPLRERMVLKRFNVAPDPEFITTTPPPACGSEPVTRFPLTVAFCRVRDPLSEKIAAPASAPLSVLASPPSPRSAELLVNVLLRTTTVPLSLKIAPPRAPPPPPQHWPLPFPPNEPPLPPAPLLSMSVPMPKPPPPPNPPFPPLLPLTMDLCVPDAPPPPPKPPPPPLPLPLEPSSSLPPPPPPPP